MSRDAEAKADPKTVRLYDKRIVERNIKKGLLSRKDYEKHLKALEDIADKGIYGGPVDDDDDDDDLRDEPIAAAPAPAGAVDAAEEDDLGADDDLDDEDDEDDEEPGASGADGNSHGP